MNTVQTSPDKLVLKHGHLCLDFTNTVFWRLREEPQEGFGDFKIFIKWGQKIGLLRNEAARIIIQEAEAHPSEAADVLDRVIDLRETLYQVFIAAAAGNHLTMEDLEVINIEISNMFQRTLLIQRGNTFEWGWNVTENALDQMLWPILRSATELLTSPELDRIGVCKGEGCGWLFYDQSRNRSRKWCDMGDCGNREKARRFYHRKRKNSLKNEQHQ